MKLHIRNYLRLLLALVLAPLLATFVVPVSYCFLVQISHGETCAAALAGYAWYGLPLALVATLLLGVPMLFIALRTGWVKAWQFVMCGTLVGTCASLLLGFADRHIDTIGVLTIAIPVSAIAASVVWIIGVRGNLLYDATTI